MKTFYRLILFLFIPAVAAVVTGCSDDTLWNDLPETVSNFITRYFPGQGIESENWNNDETVYTVKLKDSDLITFDKSLSWISVNGRGSTIPQMFLFDELPPALYEYIQSMEAVNGVYRVERTNSTITLELLNSTVIYDIKNGAISEPATSMMITTLLTD